MSIIPKKLSVSNPLQPLLISTTEQPLRIWKMQREQLPFALLPFLTFVIGGDKTDGKNQEGELIMLAFTAEIIGLTIYVARKKRIEEDKKSETEDHGRVGKEECSTGILHGK